MPGGKSTKNMAEQQRLVTTADDLHPWPVEAGDETGASWAIYAKNQEFRAFDDWPSSDLIELAKVSKLQAMVFEEMNKLEDEGLIVYGGKSGLTPVENPRNRAISTLNSTITATMRRLGITSASSADRETKAGRGKARRTAQGAIKKDDDGKSRSGTAFM